MIKNEVPKHAVSEEETKALWLQRQDIESFLHELRERGAWQIECIRAVRQMASMSLGQAKEIVHYSKTWADMRESSEALHSAAWAALEQIQREEVLAEEPIAH